MTNELFIRKEGAPAGFIQPHLLSDMPPETPLLVAFSGGADSRLLLELAVRYGRHYGAPVYAAHLHHGIRGEEADRDLAFCEETAESLGVTLFSLCLDIPAMAQASGRSTEHEAREARYAFFSRLMKEHGIPLLLTAHHADDQLETLLLRLLRGTGTHGMSGIPPVRPMDGGKVIRPLLGCTKDSILEVCHSLGLTYVTDSTNEEDGCTRNRIRHEVIPVLESLAGVGVPQTAAKRLSQAAAEDHAYLTAEAHKLYQEALTSERQLNPATISEAHPAVAKRALAEGYAHYVPSCHRDASLTAAHLDALLALCLNQIHGASVALPHGWRGEICDGMLCFTDQAPTVPQDLPPIPLREGDTPWDGGRMIIRIQFTDAPVAPLTDDGVIASGVFPDSPIPLWARYRRNGDVIRHHGVGRKLKKLLCDTNVPPTLRDRLPLICYGDDATPLWFPTAGFADGFPPPTKGRALRISILASDAPTQDS